MTGADPKSCRTAPVSVRWRPSRAFSATKRTICGRPINQDEGRTDFITPLLAAFGWTRITRPASRLACGKSLKRPLLAKSGFPRSRTMSCGLPASANCLLRPRSRASIFTATGGVSDAAIRDSASLPIAVLTNFHQLAGLEPEPKPHLTDEAHVARILLVRYDEFEAPLTSCGRCSRARRSIPAISTGASPSMRRGRLEQFDDFLCQVRSWRERLRTHSPQHTRPVAGRGHLCGAAFPFADRLPAHLRRSGDRTL